MTAEPPSSCAHARDDAVHLPGEAVDGPRLHGVHGVLADDRPRVGQLDLEQPGGAGGQGVQGDLDARGDGVAQVLAGGGDGAVGGGGAEVHGDAGTAVQLVGRHGVDDEVGAHLARVAGEDGHAGLDAGADDQGLEAELGRGHGGVLAAQPGHHRGDRQAGDASPASSRPDAGSRREGRRSRRRSCGPRWRSANWRPGPCRRTAPLGLGVAYIDGQKHVAPPRRRPARGSVRQQGQAHVHGRRPHGEGAGGDEVHSRSRRWPSRSPATRRRTPPGPRRGLMLRATSTSCLSEARS